MAKQIQINLLQAAHMAGKDFQKGLHKVDDKVKSDSMFKSLSKAGLAQEVVDQKTIDAENDAKVKELNELIKVLEGENKELKKQLKK